jgi:hypothetical protein
MSASTVAPSLWECELGSGQPVISDARTPERGQGGPGRTTRGLVAARGGGTLDEAITRLWEEIVGHHAVTCPWCQGEMRPSYGAAARPVGGRCADCGARLS